MYAFWMFNYAQSLDVDLVGKHAVVIGRSNIVGKPMAQLLLKEPVLLL